MKVKPFGQSGFEASILGFGCMRLPTKSGKPFSGDILEDEAVNMIRHAVDNGVNYMDTAYFYHDGRSEVVLGKALKKGYRKKVRIATKSPSFLIKEAGDFERYLDEQMKRMDVDFIDYYLLHALNRKRWEKLGVGLDLPSRAEKAIKDGKIGHFGFSFHDSFEAFQTIVDGYDKWEFCQLQLNYMNEEEQAGLKGMQYAASKGLDVIAMEPLLGGKLANPAPKIVEAFQARKPEKSPVQWALDYLWSKPEITLVLSGMSNMEQVRQNLLYAESASSFTPEDDAVIREVQTLFREMTAVPCTECSYCMPCPNGVDIPRNFELYNEYFLYDSKHLTRSRYSELWDESEGKKNAYHCTKCRVCETKCPQRIAIGDWMPQVHETLK